MKKIDTSFVTGSEGQPFLGRSLAFLQESYQEVINAIVNNMIGVNPSTDVHRIYGVQNSGSGSTYNISAGAVYYNGEIYLVDAAVFSTVGPQVAIMQIVQTFDAVDPILFESGASNSVHQVRKIQVLAGTSGSGLIDYSALKNVYKTYNERKYVVVGSSPGSSGTPTYTNVVTLDTVKHKIIDPSFSVGFALTTSNGGGGAYANIGVRIEVNGVPNPLVQWSIVHKDFFLSNYSYYHTFIIKPTNMTLNPGDVVKVQYGTVALFSPIATVDNVTVEFTGTIEY